MTIAHVQVEPHLNYFLCLEADIQSLSRWVEFSLKNQDVYSIELARLLMTASAEADVVAKHLCATIEPATEARNINAYQAILCRALPVLPTIEVEMPRYGMTFKPWSNWRRPSNPPDWWQGNNKVKHHRAQHFEEASLKNVLNASAALLVLLLLYFKSQGVHHISPFNLFLPKTIAMPNGIQLLILIPDGSDVPWPGMG